MENPNNSQIPSNKPVNKWVLASFAGEIGFIIALPLVAFALGGKWLDTKMGNSTPWFTLLGIFVAITLTTVWMIKRLKQYIK